MRSSIYQDFKSSSSGEVFYSSENFEKDFLELIRLEKNLTGRDFDLTQKQFSECKFCREEWNNDCFFSNECIGRRRQNRLETAFERMLGAIQRQIERSRS